MKKIKFLSGISAVFALAAVAFATFTSCEKEDFTVSVTPLPNAKAEIKPIVLYIEEGQTKDVSTVAEFNNFQKEFEGNPNLAETSVSITATYNEVSATIEVKVPQLSAGQYVVLTPTIVLSKEYIITREQIGDPSSWVNKEVIGWVDNTSNYILTFTGVKASYKEKSGALPGEVDMLTNNATYIAAVNVLANELNTYKEIDREVTVDEFQVFSYGRTNIVVDYIEETVKYTFYKKDAPNTKAEPEVLAYVEVVDYQTTHQARPQIWKDDVEGDYISIPGIDHAPGHGHGHGHSHGDDVNAGGGIILAD